MWTGGVERVSERNPENAEVVAFRVEGVSLPHIVEPGTIGTDPVAVFPGRGDRQAMPETTLTWTALTGFERDLLQAAAALEHDGEPTSGVTLRRYLERNGYEAVSHGRVYQNLSSLEDAGALERLPVDGRTFHYRPTDRGRRVAHEHLDAARAAFARS